jgi:hypothetical protein
VHRLEQRLVEAGPVDARGELERLLDGIGLARGEDPLPLLDALDSVRRRVPHSEVFRLGPRAPGPAEVASTRS